MKPIAALHKPPPLHVSVQESLRAYIADNRLEAGAPLPSEGELAARLGVSRNSVREGIKAMESLGVLEVRRGSGVFVRAFSFEPLLANLTYGLGGVLEAIENVVAVRRALELGLIERTLGAITADDLNELRATVEAMRGRAERGEAFPEEDRRFHLLLVRCHDNAILTRLIEVFWLAFHRAASVTDLHNPDPVQTWRDHAAIVDAIAARDLAAVRDRLERHYDGIAAVIALNRPAPSGGRR